jgi:hypothetical protein
VLLLSAIRIVPYGRVRRNSIVASSILASSAVASINRLPTPLIWPQRLIEAITSSAIITSPLWKGTPVRSLIVWVSLSSLTVLDSASIGTGW